MPLALSVVFFSGTAQAQSARRGDERIDLAMGSLENLKLLRLTSRLGGSAPASGSSHSPGHSRICAPPVKRGPGIKPPFMQEPPDAQKDFRPLATRTGAPPGTGKKRR